MDALRVEVTEGERRSVERAPGEIVHEVREPGRQCGRLRAAVARAESEVVSGDPQQVAVESDRDPGEQPDEREEHAADHGEREPDACGERGAEPDDHETECRSQ